MSDTARPQETEDLIIRLTRHPTCNEVTLIRGSNGAVLYTKIFEDVTVIEDNPTFGPFIINFCAVHFAGQFVPHAPDEPPQIGLLIRDLRWEAKQRAKGKG